MARKLLRKSAPQTTQPVEEQRRDRKRRKHEVHDDNGDDGDEQDPEGDDDDEDDDGEEEEEDDLRIAVGYDTNNVTELSDLIELAAESNLNLVVAPLFHPRLRMCPANRGGSHGGSRALVTRSDMALSHADWVMNVIGKASEWIDIDGSRAAEEALLREYTYAGHLGLQALMVGLPVRPPQQAATDAAFARALVTLPASSVDVWVRVPLSVDAWARWDQLRHLANHDKKLFVALEAHTADCDPAAVAAVDQRWLAEPVKALVLWTRCFSVSKKTGNAVLRGPLKAVLVSLARKVNLHVVVKGRPVLGLHAYVDCLETILRKERDAWYRQRGSSLYERFCRPFRDALRSPLQPLADNLDSKTYQVMEEDPVKYDAYERAAALALRDKWAEVQRRPTPPPPPRAQAPATATVAAPKSGWQAVRPSAPPVPRPPAGGVVVAGAGRGGVLARVLSAVRSTGVPARVYALEKNPHAVTTLRNRARDERWEAICPVEVVEGDMRSLPAPEAGDVVVSELLGSWGDNELSPECLNAVQQRWLRADGVSIPTSYTSFIAPLASHKLYTAARLMPVMVSNQGTTLSAHVGTSAGAVRTGLDSPYVVHFHQVPWCRAAGTWGVFSIFLRALTSRLSLFSLSVSGRSPCSRGRSRSSPSRTPTRSPTRRSTTRATPRPPSPSPPPPRRLPRPPPPLLRSRRRRRAPRSTGSRAPSSACCTRTWPSAPCRTASPRCVHRRGSWRSLPILNPCLPLCCIDWQGMYSWFPLYLPLARPVRPPMHLRPGPSICARQMRNCPAALIHDCSTRHRGRS